METTLKTSAPITALAGADLDLFRDGVPQNGNSPEQSARLRYNEFHMFALWASLPCEDREKLGLPTQNDFANKYKIDPSTLSDWKKRPEFWRLRDLHLKKWARELTPHVLRALYKRTLKIDYAHPIDTKLWFQIVEGFEDKAATKQTETKPFVFTEEDIRRLIAYLPEERQKYFYQTFGDLIAEAKQARDSKRLEGAFVDNSNTV